jgi:hypothetical protein
MVNTIDSFYLVTVPEAVSIQIMELKEAPEVKRVTEMQSALQKKSNSDELYM